MRYDPAAWQKIAGAFDNGFAQFGWEPYRLNILGWALDVTTESLLDVGCCRGEITHAIKEQFAGRVVGVDITPAFIEDARSKGLEALVADARALPFRDGEFETVLLLNVIMHLDDPRAAVAEAARVARRHFVLSAYTASETTAHHEGRRRGRGQMSRFLSWAYPDETLRSFVPPGWVCRRLAYFTVRNRELAQYLFEREAPDGRG